MNAHSRGQIAAYIAAEPDDHGDATLLNRSAIIMHARRILDVKPL